MILHTHLNSGTYFAIYLHIGKMGDKGNMETILLQIFGCENKCLYRLIHCPRSNCLHLSIVMLTKNTSDCACDGRGSRISCDFDYVHREPPCEKDE